MNIVTKHLGSYRHSIRGIRFAFRYETNMIFHAAAALAVILLNILLQVTKTEWLITLMCIGLAWMAELFNTSIEKLADRVTTTHDALIGQVKDLASGAVLIISIIAAICGAMIYLPYLWECLS